MHSIVALLALAILSSASIPAVTLSGRVVEETSGSALPSAELRVYRNGTRGLTAELETDGEGRFFVEGLPEGDYRIEFSKPNHIGSSLRTKLLESAPSNLAIRLIRCGTITGRVLDTNTQPVPGAKVFALTKGQGPLRRDLDTGRFATVDGAGRYRLFNLPPGQYLLAISYGASAMQLGSTGTADTIAGLGSGVQMYPTNARPQPFKIVSGSNFNNIDFSVLPSNLYAISGKVETGATTPAQGRYWLALVNPEHSYLAIAATIADADGTFHFKGIASGSYDLLLSGPSNGRRSDGAMLKDDARFARQRVIVGSQDVASLVLTPQMPRSVSVTLKAPATVECAKAGQLSLYSTEEWGAVLDREAAMPLGVPQTITRLAPAHYKLSVKGLGENCFVPEGTAVDLTATAEATSITIPVVAAGSIQGKIGAAAPANTSITLSDLTDTSQPTQVAAADKDLRFHFSPLRPGRYRLSLKLSDGTPAFLEVDVPGGAPVELTVPQ